MTHRRRTRRSFLRTAGISAAAVVAGGVGTAGRGAYSSAGCRSRSTSGSNRSGVL